MQLAADPIVIEIAGEAYQLRPTLLAAMRLARKHGDFATIYKAILADHITTLCDVVGEGSGSPQAAADLLTASEIPGLRSTLAPLKLPLLRFVLQLAGHDDEEQGEATGKPIPFAKFHSELFRIGTGWLGWSPAATWAATPAEIIEAQRGRTALLADVLKAVFGGKSDTPDESSALMLDADGFDTAFDREALAALKGRVGKIVKAA